MRVIALIPIIASVALVVVMLGGGQDAHAQFQGGGVEHDGVWHAGEGLKQGDYFSYTMCYVDYKECSKFRLDLWIRGDIEVGSETKWLAETVVYDGNKIVLGHMELGKLAPEPTGGTDNLNIYRGAFKSSVVWLSAFATEEHEHGGKGPKAFRDTSWGKIGNIGGEQIVPMAIDEIKVADRTWDTIIVGWKTGGKTSQIWVVDDFPFPIKAKTFTHVSEGIPPVEYEFSLLKYEEGVETNPFSDIVPTSELLSSGNCETEFDRNTSITKTTVNAMYQVNVFYGPEDPKPDCPMQWLIKFISKYDQTEFLNQVHFDVFVVDENLTPIRSIAGEEGKPFLYSASGQYLLDMIVNEEPGTANYAIWIYGLSPKNIVPSSPPDYVIVPVEIYPAEDELSPVEDVQLPSMVPSWIKTNAGWWADGQIDDTTFVTGIQYLITQQIIVVPPTDVTAGDSQDATEIPSWIKTNAGWWADGQIDDTTFVQAIQYLIGVGIMTIV